MGLNLYLLTQSENRGYDTYDSCVVAAASPEDAVLIDPRGDVFGSEPNVHFHGWKKGTARSYDSWASSPAAVKAKLVGVAAEGVYGVVCSSFNAG